MDPRDFLNISKQMFDKDDPSAAECRSAISRSYYAAFNVASSLIHELRISLDKQKDSHKEVIDLIAKGNDKRLERACHILLIQKELRRKADYRMEETSVETRQKASQAWVITSEAIKILDAVRADQARWDAASAEIIKAARIEGKIVV
jgi:uncharacterized protein (UPF0332 family)